MAATFGAIGRITYGARTNTVIPLPAGVADGNFLYMGLIIANSGTAVTATLPAGWTQIGAAQTGSDGSFGMRYIEAWRIASSEPANYTCTHAASNSEGHIISVTGAGTLSIDASSQNQGNSSTSVVLGVTTTQANDLLLMNGLNWDVVVLAPPTGMTEQQDSQFLYIASQVVAAAGVVADKSQSHGGNPWFANLLAIKDVAGGGGSGKPAKVWSGSAWVTKTVKVWSGSAWVAKPVKVWNGSAWV